MALFGSPPTPPPSRLDELKRILQRDPTSRQFLALAEEYRRQGKLRDAIITLERGLSIHTSSVAAHVALGKVYQQLERYEDATRAFQSALRYDRENLVAIRHLADVYIERGETLEAVKKLKLYRGLKPGEREVQELIARLEAELEPRPVGRFPSGIRPRHGEPAAAAATPVPAAPRPEAPASAATGPFELPPEPVWRAPVFELPTDATVTMPAGEAGPPAEEVFPAAGMREREIAEEPPPPVRVSSTPDVPAFFETELGPPPAAPDLADTVVSAPPPSPEPPPPEPAAVATFDSGIRRGLVLKESHEAPAPIEMPPEEPVGAPEAPPEPPAGTVPDAAVPAQPEAVSAPAPGEAEIRPSAVPPAPAGMDASESPTGPLVTETLAELYRSQGYLQEAREVYLTLAASATDPEAAAAYAGKAEALRATRETAAMRRRLEGLLSPFAPAPPLKTDDLSALLRSLMAEVPGLKAAALTDRDGLPVVSEGFAGEGEALEVLVAELTSFVRGVGRSGAEIGGGALRSLALVGERGTAVLANVTSDYALILEAEPDAALGEVRWFAARAAERLRPAVG